MTILSLLQWNVQSSEPLEAVCAYIEQMRPDVICLQELTIGHPTQQYRHGPNYVAARMGYDCCFVALSNVTPDGSGVVLANAILTSGTIVSSRSALLSRPSRSLGYEYQSRGYVEAGVVVQGMGFTVATAHLGYSNRFRMTIRRRKEVRRLIIELSRTPHRLVFSGDLNAEPQSYAVAMLERGLKAAGPAYSVPTWTTKPFQYRGFYANDLRWRLDYIFVTDDVGIVEASALDAPVSDHRPIMCRFSII
jgi:endonuclease/exonuclease/phosphatase family metal-dependent hydrolase